MAKTRLDLLFIDKADSKIIYIQDVSDYNKDIDVEDPVLTITPPNFSTQYSVIYPTLNLIPINSNALGWTNSTDYDIMLDMPDGLWNFKISIKPNDCLFRDFKYFRTTILKKQIFSYVSEQLDISNSCCNVNDGWYQDIFNLLQQLDSAKYLAENCDKCEEAKIMYDQISKQFKKYSCNSGC